MVEPSTAELRMGCHGFLKAEAAPMTTAKTIPRPAPRDAPIVAAEIELDLSCESVFSPASLARSRESSSKSLSLVNSFNHTDYDSDLYSLY